MHNSIYKMGAYSFNNEKPVSIDNTVRTPSEVLEEDDDAYAERRFREEQARKQKEKEELIERERRFNAEVQAEIARVLAIRTSEIERERVAIIENANAYVKNMTDEAKNSTAAVIERATKECGILKEKAKADGFKEGFEEGKKQAENKAKNYLEEISSLLGEINAHKNAYYISNELELRETLFSLVQKVTMQEIETKPQIIENIISDAAKNFRNSDYIKISLAKGEVSRTIKTDAKLIKKLIPYIKEVDIEILSDAEDGTVILDNNNEIVDASVPTQLEFLKEIIRTTRGEGEENL